MMRRNNVPPPALRASAEPLTEETPAWTNGRRITRGTTGMGASAAKQRWETAAFDDAAADENPSGAGVTIDATLARRYELCFHALDDERCAFAFPCDASGHVDLDSLDERARHDYLYARAVIGRVLARPAVRRH